MQKQNIYANCVSCFETIYVHKRYNGTAATLSSELFFVKYQGVFYKDFGYLCLNCYKNITKKK
ncbi:hypothetical protein [Chrysodeixis includens nucleopolyhedrovirus]|uniref:Uncharacterized protein n=1 Tax=Chrysodeixis includens nucleopolyhedrovirus TaxID=1207438 RepID=A0A5B8YR67_9ABAC|nr:hypothetical protein QKU06_gp031 [Chrysodeixis includens nucleopolyhedrovirus]QED40559.1 hypothetical protein [Chrysodeixis includens nucleopolyhedrovirus]